MPVIGNLPGLTRGPLAFLTDNARSYGDRVAWTLPGTTIVQLTHPDDIEAVLVRHKDIVLKDAVTHDLQFLLGDGLLTAEGDVWKAHRKLIAPAFQPRHLGAYGEAMVRSAHEDPQEGRLDVHAWMSRVTLAIVLRTLFGVEPGGEADAVAPALEQLMHDFDAEVHGPAAAVPAWMPLPHRRRLRRNADRLDTVLRRLVRERARGPAGEDLLWRLIEARDDEGRGLSEAALRDEAITLFLAGHETTALALGYTLWLLGGHPEAQDAVQAELREVLGTRDATPADLDDLPRTRAALDEAMRLYPPAWTIGRRITAPLELEGGVLPTGTEILLPQWVVHRDPRWFRDPETFRPARWLDGETTGLPRFAYFPFGGGPRVCIGSHFAAMEAMLVLATLLRTYRFTAHPGWVPELVPSVTLRPRRGVPMDVSRRRVSEPGAQTRVAQ